jgi:hypothetical protein
VIDAAVEQALAKGPNFARCRRVAPGSRVDNPSAPISRQTLFWRAGDGVGRGNETIVIGKLGAALS